jgi:hypothetical protein
MEETTNPAVQAKGSSAGPIIAGIVILAVIIFGALYFMGERQELESLETELNSINTQSSSDEAAAIEADLNATDVDDLDAEINAS